MTDTPARPLRILELGGAIFRDAAPDQTDFYWVDRRNRRGRPLLGPINTARVLARLWRRQYDLVVVHAPHVSPWHPRSFLIVLRDWHVRALPAFIATLMPRYLHHLHRVPTVGIDLGDTFGIRAHNRSLIDRSVVYFKRELPVDKWQVFFRSAHWDLPGSRWRRRKRSQRRMNKLRPITLTAGPWAAPGSGEKTADIFFAGQIDGDSSVRSEGVKELLALRQEGFVVDVPETRIDHAEFRSRLAGAWLAWSPEGLGWDCYRHYESGLLGTVPVINNPTIIRHAPLVHGEHCFYYPPEPGGLSAVVRAALSDRPKLARMAEAARRHVLAHHMNRPRVDYILKLALGRRLDGTRVED